MKKPSKGTVVSMLLKLGIIAGCICGLVATAGDGGFMATGMFLFFTIQSNIWIACIAAVFLVFDVIGLKRGAALIIPQWLYKIKFMFTVAITLTFLVFSLMLTPWMISIGYSSYLWTLSNVCLHNLVPIFAILDWCLYNYEAITTKRTFLLGAIMPLYYLFFALILSFNGVEFGNGAKVPYFFLDYEANGWFNLGNGQFGVAYWIMVLVVVVLAMSYGFVAAKCKRARTCFNADNAIIDDISNQ